MMAGQITDKRAVKIATDNEMVTVPLEALVLFWECARSLREGYAEAYPNPKDAISEAKAQQLIMAMLRIHGALMSQGVILEEL